MEKKWLIMFKKIHSENLILAYKRGRANARRQKRKKLQKKKKQMKEKHMKAELDWT